MQSYFYEYVAIYQMASLLRSSKTVSVSARMATSSKRLAIILGVGLGSGTGASTARIFARAGYSVAVAGRQQQGLDKVVQDITKQGGEARAWPVNDYSEASLQSLFRSIREDSPDVPVRFALYNGGLWQMGNFLSLSASDLSATFDQAVLPAWVFGQEAIKAFQGSADTNDNSARGTLIFTGASAALRGSANFAAFAIGKFSIRALSQSLAREFCPQGIHVAHSIVDGIIVTDRLRPAGKAKHEEDPTQLLNPDSIAKSYLYLAGQDRSCFTQELDLRPGQEKF